MSDVKDGGGPAFPCTNEQLYAPHAAPGQSLLDYCAIKMAQALITGWEPKTEDGTMQSVATELARDAYDMAEAMVAEAAKRKS